MSAAEVLKAEMAGLVPLKRSASSVSAATVQGHEIDDFDVPGLGHTDPALPCISHSLDKSVSSVSLGQKRSAEDVEAEDAQIDVEEDIVVAGENDSSTEEEEPSYTMVVRADGSVEQADNVRYASPFTI